MTSSRSLPTVAPVLTDLARHGAAPALVLADRTIDYQVLARQVASVGEHIWAGRRLTVLQMGNDESSIVHYLAALSAGNVVALVGPGEVDRVIARLDPDTHIHGSSGRIEHRRDESRHALYPGLALLLQTSGSTGAARLVRLSYDNIEANAMAVAESLGLGRQDRAATTLPLHYTYGLSVLHSHLAIGASIAVTDRSVIHPDFLPWLRRTAVTALPGVPHTYDMLMRSGFGEADLPDLRLITQAGGRMSPDMVRDLADLGAARGFDVRIMYGQTEATARMTCMPAGMAARRPDSVGRVVPGGCVALRRVAGTAPDVGELVYRGPNVMLGYADSPADLTRGRDIDELPTGDLARIDADGVVTVVGRRSHFAKIFGLRIDLATAENALADRGASCAVVDLGDALGVAWVGDDATPAQRVERIRWDVSRATGLPLTMIHLRMVPELPRTDRGKTDRRAAQALFDGVPGAPGALSVGRSAGSPPSPRPIDEDATSSRQERIRRCYAGVLGIDPATVRDSDSFVSLGGDSLTYVVAFSRLDRELGRLPRAWHTLTIEQLLARSGPVGSAGEPSLGGGRRPRWPLRLRRPDLAWGARDVETSVVLRAVAIILVVGSHIGLMDIRGGAHVLLAVAGYNYARFHLSVEDRRRRLRGSLSSVVRIVVPSAVWLALVVILGSEYGWSVLFAVNLFGPEGRAPEWRYWYLEALVFVAVAIVLVMAVPAIHRLESHRPFSWAMVLVAVGLGLRFAFAAESGPAGIYTPVMVGWLFAVGWALAVARVRWQQAVALAALGAGLIGYFDDPARAALVAGGVIALAFLPRLRMPGLLARAVVAVAGASLFIYLTHWQVYPPVAHSAWVALILSVATGVAADWLWRRIQAEGRRHRRGEARSRSVASPVGLVDTAEGTRGHRDPTPAAGPERVRDPDLQTAGA